MLDIWIHILWKLCITQCNSKKNHGYNVIKLDTLHKVQQLYFPEPVQSHLFFILHIFLICEYAMTLYT